MWSDELREIIVEELQSYLEDNIDEAVDLAEQLEFDWARVYSGLSELYCDYFGSDLAEIISAFQSSETYPDNWSDYSVIEDEVCESDCRADHAEYECDHIASMVAKLYEDDQFGKYGLDPSKDIMDILERQPDVMDIETLKSACAYDYYDIIGSVYRFNNGEITYDEILDICELVSAEHIVKNYLFETDFCGVPEVAYEKIMDDYRWKDNECRICAEIALNYVMDNKYGSSVGLKKFADLFMNKYKEV